MGHLDRRDFLKYLSLLPVVPVLDRVAGQQPHHDDDRANVIILVFDALSARHLSLYGYHRQTTPNLARFAGRSIVYHSHYAAGNFTIPGTASLLTGTYPWTHRAFNTAGRTDRPFERRNIFTLFGDRYNRIAYPHNVYAHLLLGQMRQNVDVYLDPQTFSLFDDMFYYRLLSGDRDMSFRAMEELLFPNNRLPGSLFLALMNRIKTLTSVESTRKRLEGLYPRGIPFLHHYRVYFLVEDVLRGTSRFLGAARQPLLAYLHFFPPHGPYRPRREFAGTFDDGWEPLEKAPYFFSQGCSQGYLNQERRWYDEYIAQVDAEFGRMVDSLRRNGLLDTSYLVITSDHGELFERGVLSHMTPLLYDPIIHIPLLISTPGQEMRRDVHAPTSCVDLLPTMAHLIGEATPDWCEGQVLPELGGDPDKDRAIFAVEAKENAAQRPLTQGTIAMIKGDYKLIHYFGYEGCESAYELYNLKNDPEELENLYTTTHPIAADMAEELRRKLHEVNRPYA